MLNLYDIYQNLILEAKSKNIREIIEFAIQTNTTIRIYYKGDRETTAGWRLIEPYLLGVYDTKNKPIVLRALQVSKTKSLTPNGNGSDPLTALPNGWRIFRLDRILDVKSGVGKFQPMKRPEYNMNDRGMSKILMGVLKTTKKVGDLYFSNT